MNDNDLRSLFSSFRPPLGDTDAFLDALDRRVEAVEYIRRRSAQIGRRHAIALVIALVAGFVAGFACAQLVPVWQHLLPAALNLSILGHSVSPLGLGPTMDATLPLWIATALAVIVLAFAAYRLSLTLLLRHLPAQAAR